MVDIESDSLLRAPRGESIMRPKSLRILLAACFASLSAMAASAEVTDVEQRASPAARRENHSMSKAIAIDSAKTDAPAISAPANVLEDSPRDARSKPVGTCARDRLDGQALAECRRRLEIAQTL